MSDPIFFLKKEMHEDSKYSTNLKECCSVNYHARFFSITPEVFSSEYVVISKENNLKSMPVQQVRTIVSRKDDYPHQTYGRGKKSKYR